MKKLTTRILALLMAAAMLFTLGACTKDGDATKTGTGTDGAVFTAQDNLDIIVGSHVSWPFNENWVVWDYIREAVGGNLNITAIPSSDWDTKLSLMMANPGDLPDLMHFASKSSVDIHALSGAFIPISDVEEQMPNYKAFMESLPEAERNVLLSEKLSGDGKIYSGVAYGMNNAGQIWMYRKDVFEEHGLKVPTNQDELYEVCKKLKELYPDSYPLCLRSGINSIATFGTLFTPYFNPYIYYDFENAEWKYGAIEPAMKEIIDFLIKFQREGLMPPDFMTIESKAWEELMSTDRGFITMDHLVRVDFFTPSVREVDPDFTLALMEPPMLGKTDKAQRKIARAQGDKTGYAICNTGDEKGIANAVKFIDWMYTDEAAELLSWGKEGETYKINENGEKEFILSDDGSDINNLYGLQTYGTYQRVDPIVSIEAMSDEQGAMVEEARNYYEDRTCPKFWMAFSDEELKRRELVRPEIEAYTQEMISKFILEQAPLSEWDTFVKTIKDMGLEEFLNVHREAYARVEASVK